MWLSLPPRIPNPEQTPPPEHEDFSGAAHKLAAVAVGAFCVLEGMGAIELWQQGNYKDAVMFAIGTVGGAAVAGYEWHRDAD